MPLRPARPLPLPRVRKAPARDQALETLRGLAARKSLSVRVTPSGAYQLARPGSPPWEYVLQRPTVEALTAELPRLDSASALPLRRGQ